jgi:hypothetical protein
VKEFEVESPIGDEPLSAVAAELKRLAEPYGYIVTDLAPSGAGTSRTHQHASSERGNHA